MSCNSDDQLCNLLEQALSSPRERANLLRQQETLLQILKSIPARRWLHEQACQTKNGNRAAKARLLIIALVQYSGKIKRRRSDTAPDDYDEALARTWEWFSKELHSYDPQQASFVTWFNGTLEWRIRDVINERIRDKQRRYHPPISSDDEDVDPINLIPSGNHAFEDSRLFMDQLLTFVERDPGRHLRNCQMQEHPNVTCQRVILVILQSYDSPNVPWNKMTQEFGVDKQSLHSFCRNTAFPNFRQFCQRNKFI